jgi:hypothetical protein
MEAAAHTYADIDTRWVDQINPIMNKVKLQPVLFVATFAVSILSRGSFASAQTVAMKEAMFTRPGPACMACATRGESTEQFSLQNSLRLSGKVSVAHGARLDFKRLSLRLLPEDRSIEEVSAEVSEDGLFKLTELSRGNYRLRISGLPDGWYLQSASLGSQNVLSSGLKLAEQQDLQQSLEMTVSLGASKVQGIVLDPVFHDAVPNAVVKLFPDPPNPHRADLYHQTKTDENGQFVISNIVPGGYRALAIIGQDNGESDDSLFARSAGVRLALREKQTKNVELELFAAHK